MERWRKCPDTGLINVATPRFSENTGRLAENLVAIELVKRHGIENVSYWKDTRQREVDFAIKDGLRVRQLIQVCWNVGNKETKKRELDSLMAAMNEFKLKTGLILTEDYEGQEKTEGKKIAYTPLWKWLLQPVYF